MSKQNDFKKNILFFLQTLLGSEDAEDRHMSLQLHFLRFLHFLQVEGEEDEKKVRRNEKCPCGSGKKFKHCHGSV